MSNIKRGTRREDKRDWEETEDGKGEKGVY